MNFRFLNDQTSFCMQAMGDGRDTLIHAVVRILILYIPLMYQFKALMGANGLCLALIVAEALAGVAGLLLLAGWIRKRNKKAETV